MSHPQKASCIVDRSAIRVHFHEHKGRTHFYIVSLKEQCVAFLGMPTEAVVVWKDAFVGTDQAQFSQRRPYAIRRSRKRSHSRNKVEVDQLPSPPHGGGSRGGGRTDFRYNDELGVFIDVGNGVKSWLIGACCFCLRQNEFSIPRNNETGRQ